MKKEQESNMEASVLEDRERSIWIGDARGLVQLRDGIFNSYGPSDSVFVDPGGPVFVDERENLWSAPASGGISVHGRDGTRKLPAAGLSADVVYSIDGLGPDIWLGRQRGGLTHLHVESGNVTAQTFTKADGLPQNTIYTVRLSKDGSVWAGSLTGGVSHLRDGNFKTYTAADGLASDDVSAIEEGDAGAMWFGTSSGLSSLSAGHWHSYSTADGLPSNEVLCLFRDHAGSLWIGTKGGLALWSNGRLQSAVGWDHRVELSEPTFGIAEDNQGKLWVATNAHVFSIERKAAQGNIADFLQLRDFGPDDGLTTTEGVQRDRSVVSDRLGQIWFSLRGGVSMVSPGRLGLAPSPTMAHVTSVVVDGHTMQGRQLLKISSAHRRIAFYYTGLCLAMPDRVRYRYRLRGFDPGWSDMEAVPEAVYTNLSHGSYTFEVEAVNGLVATTVSAASVALVIEPTLWQTWPFQLACVLLALLGAAAIYRLRMQQLLHQANVRFEERLAERARIARDLHDTLLQGFLSASMQLHIATDQVASDSPAKPLLGRILELMRQVIEEGRTAVKGLRTNEAGDRSLEASFAHMPGILGNAHGAAYRVVVEGTSRTLHAVIYDEVRQIGQEALVNAERHAHANTIEVAIHYAPAFLLVTVRDDGCGVDPRFLQQGRPGHWGLPGMRERAERIGAKLQLFSSPSSGTEVKVSVPGRIAYEQQSSSRVVLFFCRLLLIQKRSVRTKTRKLL